MSTATNVTPLRQSPEFTPLQKTRLSIATKIAASMAANPSVVAGGRPGWEDEVAVSSIFLADRLIALSLIEGY